MNAALRRRMVLEFAHLVLAWSGRLAAVALVTAGLAATAWAQTAAKPVAAPGAKSDKAPPPVDVGGSELTTDDGVQLKATYFGREEGQEVVPVVLLHAWKGSRKDYDGLAAYLQAQGMAVLAPDLRGHGDSRRQVLTYGAKQKDLELDAGKFRAPDFHAMVAQDMAAIRRFLVQKNNAKQLNLNKLVLVGAEMGAAIALEWAAYDWSLPNYAGLKQSQDVKALVLLSPQKVFQGLNTSQALNHPAIQRRLALMILVGKQDPLALGEAERLNARLKAFREDVSSLPAAERRAKRTLWFGQFPTRLQGTKMLGVSSLNLPMHIADFIKIRVVEGENAPWIERKR